MFNRYCNTLDIIFWDVQHGNAIFIRTPNGKIIIQDLGVGDYSENIVNFSPLTHIRNEYRVYNIEHLIITHPHLDHIEDIQNLNLFRINLVSYPYTISKSEIEAKIYQETDRYKRKIFQSYLQFINRYSALIPNQYNPGLSGDYGGALFKLYYPKPNVADSYKENNHSLVTIILYAGYKIILSGDNGISSWNYLLNNRNFKSDIRNTDIFLASHHGRESGYCDLIFRYFKPKLTIISDGRFGTTSITKTYSNLSQGYYIDNLYKRRKCLTTRYDGVIYIRIGYYRNSYPFMKVKTQY